MAELHLDTIDAVLDHQSRVRPGAVAVIAPGRDPLTYGALRNVTREFASQVVGLGLDRGARVAVVMPNGPEMATAFLAVSTIATVAPLNPALPEREFELLLRAMKVDALLVLAGCDSPARVVATRLDIPVLESAVVSESPAGTLRIVGVNTVSAVGGRCGLDDSALVLPTSGTTSAPKIVPLSHRNVCTSAANISSALELSAADRCLNVMPLFHIHGLIGAVLASIASGASVVVSARRADRLRAWIRNAFLNGWMSSNRPGTRLSPPCTRRCSTARPHAETASRALGSVSSDRLRRPFRPRSCAIWNRSSASR